MALNSTPRRRFGVALGVVLTGVAAGLIGFAGTASAHTPTISAKCDEKTTTTSLNVKLTSYNGSKANTIKITDGDKVLHEGEFRESYQKKFDAPGDVEHKFAVVVKAHDDPKGTNRWSFTWDHLVAACVTKPPSSEPSTPPSSEPSTPPSSEPSTPPSSEPSTPPSSQTSVTPTTTVAVAPPVTSTTRPTPKPVAAETGELAETGASIALPLGIAGVLLVGGGVLLFVVRRRSKA